MIDKKIPREYWFGQTKHFIIPGHNGEALFTHCWLFITTLRDNLTIASANSSNYEETTICRYYPESVKKNITYFLNGSPNSICPI